MKTYDVIVVGAGPAGCQCARMLSKLAWKTLLVEKVTDFSKNNFSSGGSVIEIMKDYDLPPEIVGTSWKKIKLIGKSISYTWSHKKDQGVVFDFQKLREFLSNDAKRSGNCDVLFGHTFYNLEENDLYTDVTFKTHSGNLFTAKTKIIVDATGPARAVIYHNRQKPRFTADTGIEYLIKNTDKFHPASSDTLRFFLGSAWQPHGYGWIFPMSSDSFKVGVAIFDSTNQKGKPLKYYVDNIIHTYLKLKSYKVIEVHGSTLLVTPDNKELFYNKNIVAIGDAISAVNSLGGEGIRHGMYSSTVAATSIDKYLKGKKDDFNSYEKHMKNYFGWRWRLSYIYAYLFYHKLSSRFIDKIISAAAYLNIHELMTLLFDYKFSVLFKTVARKILHKKKFAITS